MAKRRQKRGNGKVRFFGERGESRLKNPGLTGWAENKTEMPKNDRKSLRDSSTNK